MSLTLPITPGKYTTRDGRRAIVWHVETVLKIKGGWCVAGCIEDGDGWIVATWQIGGKCSQWNGDSGGDLVSAGWPLKIERDKWYLVQGWHDPFVAIGRLPGGDRWILVDKTGFTLFCDDKGRRRDAAAISIEEVPKPT